MISRSRSRARVGFSPGRWKGAMNTPNFILVGAVIGPTPFIVMPCAGLCVGSERDDTLDSTQRKMCFATAMGCAAAWTASGCRPEPLAYILLSIQREQDSRP